jgi:hypothetical protein
MSKHQRGVGGKCTQHLRRGTIVELVKAAAQRLAIKGDAAPPRRGTRCLQQGGMAAKGRLHPGRIEPLEDVADSGVRGRALPLQVEDRIQPAAVDGDEGDDAAIRVAAAHDGKDGEQQHVG